jgi:acetyl-CoA carboxylase biotin carboxyl carrier protein
VKLTANDVAEIMRLVENSTFDVLDLDMDGVKLSLRRTGAAAPMGAVPSATPLVAAAATTPTPRAIEKKPSQPVAVDGAEAVRAPLLGTFYRAPKPGAPPYVAVGDTVDAETVIGIIEVMKLMNPVRAGVSGTVAAITAEDSQLVEFDEPLMFVKAAP